MSIADILDTECIYIYDPDPNEVPDEALQARGTWLKVLGSDSNLEYASVEILPASPVSPIAFLGFAWTTKWCNLKPLSMYDLDD